MSEHLTQRRCEILADKDPGVGLPGRVYLPGYSRTMGPQSHLFAERERLQSLTWEHFDVKQLSPTIGAELVGLDLSQELPDEVVSEIQQALWDYKVIFFVIKKSHQNNKYVLRNALVSWKYIPFCHQHRNTRAS